jgi:hypothetical protein
MNVQVHLTQDQVMVFEFGKNWQWEEWETAILRANKLINQQNINYNVPVVFQMPNDGTTPGGFMSNAWNMTYRLHPLATPMVVVTRSRYLNLMFESLKQFHAERLHDLFTATSLDEAWMILDTASV